MPRRIIATSPDGAILASLPQSAVRHAQMSEPDLLDAVREEMVYLGLLSDDEAAEARLHPAER